MKTKETMKKLSLIIGIIILISLSASTTPKKETKKKEDRKTEMVNIKETKPIIDNKLKDDIQSSVLEFIIDMKVSPDTCYIPFKN